MRNAPLKVSNNVDLKNKKAKWSYDYILLSSIIRLHQVRQTFEAENLQELADDIALNDIIQPSTVVKFSPKQFFSYVKMIEKISRLKILTKDFPYQDEEDGRWYYVLVAGERRFRAHQILWSSGCSLCKESAGGRLLEPGECYLKHEDKLVYGKMEARIGINIDLEKLKSIQFRENNYVKPPVHEEAHAYREYYDYLKLLDQKITMKDFAQRVGASVDKIRKAIWFCDLPKKLKEVVAKRKVSYGNALELYRVLQFEGIDLKTRLNIIDQETDFLLMHPKVKKEDYKVRVKNLLESFQSLSLFDLNELTLKKEGKRKTVEAHLITALTLYSGYTDKVLLMQSLGVIGKSKKFSGESPSRWIKRILEDIKKTIPGIPLTMKEIESLVVNLDQKVKPC